MARKHLPTANVKKRNVPRASKKFFAVLGPGLITGAADDDPSGISTYSVAGASYGYATLWISLLSFPLMAAVQLMCARLGMVTGCGLANNRRRRCITAKATTKHLHVRVNLQILRPNPLIWWAAVWPHWQLPPFSSAMAVSPAIASRFWKHRLLEVARSTAPVMQNPVG